MLSTIVYLAPSGQVHNRVGLHGKLCVGCTVQLSLPHLRFLLRLLLQSVLVLWALVKHGEVDHQVVYYGQNDSEYGQDVLDKFGIIAIPRLACLIF